MKIATDEPSTDVAALHFKMKNANLKFTIFNLQFDEVAGAGLMSLRGGWLCPPTHKVSNAATQYVLCVSVA